MNIEITRIYLRHIVPDFKDFYRATVDNRARLEPWFWWTNINKLGKFYFLCSDAIFYKMSKLVHDLPCNRKFIIRVDGKFAGIVGLDGIYVGAPKPEIWMFLTKDFESRGIATHAVKWAVDYATKMNCEKLCARTMWENPRARIPLFSNDFEIHECNYGANAHELLWRKMLNKSY